MRKSSIHFKPVENVRFAISHSERTDLSEPGYLLPKEHQIPNVVVDGSISENDLSALFIQQKEGMSRQAKTAGASPFWEGVVVLPNTDSKEQSANLMEWKKAYEQATGHRVLHISIHLDEGYVDATGNPQYNPHAHVIVSRMDSKNKVINLNRKQLAEVQDITAENLKMERGSTLAERGGRRGRAHIGHKEFRLMADEARLDLEIESNKKNFYGNLLDYKNQQENLNREKIKEANKVIAEKDEEIARLKLEHKTEVEKLKTEYLDERAELKSSGEAKQADYQQLKIAHEEMEKNLAEALEKFAAQASDITQLKEEKTKTLDEKDTEIARLENEYKAEIARLKSEYAAEREELKASGTARQSDYQQLKATHEADLAKLATARQEAATARQERDTAQATATAEQAAVVATLKADLAKARQQAEKVKERYNELHGQALAIQAERNELATKVEALTLRVPAPAQPVAAPAQAPTAVRPPEPEYVWPKLTEQQFQALPTRQLGDRVITAAREVLVMCADLADAAAKHKLFPRQVVRALESLLENYREPAKPVPTPTQAQAPERSIQQPPPERRSSIER